MLVYAFVPPLHKDMGKREAWNLHTKAKKIYGDIIKGEYFVDVLFEEHSVLCKIIRTTTGYWDYVVKVKHPESFNLIGFERSAELVKETLREPDVVMREQMDPGVYLYYKHYEKYSLCVVAKHLNGDGYIITAYMTDHIKKGGIIYEKDKGLLR